jgi:hypothetical protein
MMTSELPFRAVGGNVLLRRVKQDGSILTLEGFDSRVMQLAEVVGLGGRWTQGAQWFPPPPTIDKYRNAILDSGSLDPGWRPPDLSNRARPKPPVFTEAHEDLLRDLKVGDLVVYITARVYDHFRYESQDILVYPGNWIQGVVTDFHLADRPEVRRYERQPE